MNAPDVVSPPPHHHSHSHSHRQPRESERVDYFAHPPSRQPRSTTSHARSATSDSHTSPGTSSASSSKSTASTMSTSPETTAAITTHKTVATPPMPRTASDGDDTRDTPMNVDQQQHQPAAQDSVPLSGPNAGTPGKVRRASELSTGQIATASTSQGDPDHSHARKRQARKPDRIAGADDYFGTGPFEASSSSASHDSPQQSTQQHVDMVNYPAADLLRRLAVLLEQIARANDELARQRQLSEASGSATPARGPSSAGSSDDGMSDSRTFDVAPLNSPVTPRNRLLPLTSIASAIPEPRQPATPGGNLSTDQQMFAVGVTASRSRQGSRRGSLDMTRRPRSQQSSHDAPPSQSPYYQNDEASTYDDYHLAAAPGSGLLTAATLALSSPSATLCFHARNVPAISIEAYLQRILKYCPTTNEVFVSLLVYFDRMARIGQQTTGQLPRSMSIGDESMPSTPVENKSLVIDSYNVHRLIIAGITVASKFFSDVFYTNSRYAKVGGLPLSELNQLELQFLLLNNFDLYIPVEELQRYADQLLIHWTGQAGSSSSSSSAPTSSRRQPSTESQQPSQTSTASTRESPSTRTTNTSISKSYAAAPTQQQSQPAPNNSPSTRSSFSSSDTSGTSTVTPGSTNSTPSLHQNETPGSVVFGGQHHHRASEGHDDDEHEDTSDADRMQQD